LLGVEFLLEIDARIRACRGVECVGSRQGGLVVGQTGCLDF
jgi:hypothetical protein